MRRRPNLERVGNGEKGEEKEEGKKEGEKEK